MARTKKYFILVMAFLLGQIVSMFPVYTAQTAVFDSEFQKAGIVYEVTAFNDKQKEVQVVRGTTAKKVVRIPQKIRYQGVNFSVTAIAGKAFYKNKKLEKVEIGSSVRTIGSRAFYQTKKLKFIDIRSKKLKSIGKAAFIGIQKQAKIKVPRDKKAAYVKLLEKNTADPLTNQKNGAIT